MFSIILVSSYLAKFLGSLDSQYEILFGGNDSSNEVSGNFKNIQYMNRIFICSIVLFNLDVRDLSQKITRYLKATPRTLLLPVGEVMLNRKGKLYVLKFSVFFYMMLLMNF